MIYNTVIATLAQEFAKRESREGVGGGVRGVYGRGGPGHVVLHKTGFARIVTTAAIAGGLFSTVVTSHVEPQEGSGGKIVVVGQVVVVFLVFPFFVYFDEL